MEQFNVYYVIYNVPILTQVEQLMYIVAARDEAQVVSLLLEHFRKTGTTTPHLPGPDYAIVKIADVYSNHEGILEYAEDIYSIFK